MIDWNQTKPLPDDDPRDIEAARKGLCGTRSINAHKFLREVREGAEEIERMATRPRPKGCHPSILQKAGRWLRKIFSRPEGPRPGQQSIVCAKCDDDPNPFHNEESMI